MKKALLILSLVLAVTACNRNELITRRIIAIVSANGIGDQGYTNEIVTGFEQIYYNLDPSVYMQICTPSSMEEAYDISMANIEKAKDGIPTLIILGTSDYLTVAEKITTDKSISCNNVSMLLFEVDSMKPSVNGIDVHTFIILCYQASYNAGKYVAEKGFKKPLIWLSNPADRQLDYFRDGFSDGYYNVKKTRPDVKYISDDWTGYAMSDSAYRAMSDLSKTYDFIYPVMGGSNLGIYRYLRENPDGPYVAGMDVDQSKYSDHIVGSIIKHIRNAVVNITDVWLAGQEIPHHSIFDVSSGYIEWRVTRDPVLPQ